MRQESKKEQKTPSHSSDDENPDAEEENDYVDNDPMLDCPDYGTREYERIDCDLDELNSALTAFETNIEGISNALMELLQSNREIRQSIADENRKLQEGQPESSHSISEASHGEKETSVLEEKDVKKDECEVEDKLSKLSTK